MTMSSLSIRTLGDSIGMERHGRQVVGRQNAGISSTHLVALSPYVRRGVRSSLQKERYEK